MTNIKNYFSLSLDSQSPAMPVRIITGLTVCLVSFLWLPLGFLGLLVLLWIVYVTQVSENSETSGIDSANIVVPMDGLITSIQSTSERKIIRITQQVHSNKLVRMPVHGKIDINMFIDGLFLPADITNASNLNARREITIKQDFHSKFSETQHEISLIIWGRPFARYLASPISEGRIIKAGVPIAISLLQGDLDIILPSSCNLLVNIGEFCIGGKTVLAKQHK